MEPTTTDDEQHQDEYTRAFKTWCKVDEHEQKMAQYRALPHPTSADEIEKRDAAIGFLQGLIQAEIASISAPTTSAPVETAHNAPAKPATSVDRGWVLKKAALIEKHERQWQTINRDFQDASENGLSKAAKAPGHGDWFEVDALNWARQRNKLRKATAQQASSPATPFSGLVHRLKD